MMPRATVRLQFNRDFTLDDAEELVPYFHALGISHLYASPLVSSRSGSTHGYDATDPTEIDPELGGYAALLRLSRALERHGMGLVLDIVPNHMAADAANPWWWDVLLWGRSSRYADFFDIDWQDPDPVLQGKVLLPVLADALEACLARGELRLHADEVEGLFICQYFDARFPLDPRRYGDILDVEENGWRGLAQSARQLKAGEGLESAAGKFRADLADRLRVARPGERLRLLARFNDAPAAFQALLAQQNYVLAPWREAAERINWRRFFDINALVALRIERGEVFDAYHRFTLELVHDGIIDGVRVDHVDGLADPEGYCRRLRAALDAARPDRSTYFVVEKILDKDETLSAAWPVDGATGYDFMDQAAAVLHDSAGEATLTRLWQRLSGDRRDFAAMAREARREMLGRLFPKQLDRLLALLPVGEDRPDVLRTAMTALLAAMHRYRLYDDGTAVPAEVRNAARATLDPAQRSALDTICGAIESSSPAEFRTRFGQLSATLAAKAVEDTAFYRYGRLLSRDEVGSDPGRLAVDPARFHDDCVRRRSDFPQAMLATATHDHKRGEDSRARLAVLSEIAEEWSGFVEPLLDRTDQIDPAIQYTIIQSIIGAWPLVFDPADAAECRHFQERLEQWLTKALREAKQASSWAEPDAAFEQRCMDFLQRQLDPAWEFLGKLAPFVERIAPSGALNGLSQALLRLTTPGVPDLYRGTEFWDFSLVDPDNRAPVDFAARRAALAEIGPLDVLLPDWRSGRIKQALIARLLFFRRLKPALFAEATYEPLTVVGARARHLLAFVRRTGDDALVVLAPRHSATALGKGAMPVLPADFWADTRIELPGALRDGEARDLLGDRTISWGGKVGVASMLDRLSLAAVHVSGR